MNQDDENEAAVGYRRPPRHSRFKKGVSGNPQGRPKKTPTFAEDLNDELSEMIMFKDNGKLMQISKQRAVIKAVLSAAMKANVRALTVLVTYVRMLEADAQERAEPVAPVDLDMMEACVKQLREMEGGKFSERAQKTKKS